MFMERARKDYLEDLNASREAGKVSAALSIVFVSVSAEEWIPRPSHSHLLQVQSATRSHEILFNVLKTKATELINKGEGVQVEGVLPSQINSNVRSAGSTEDGRSKLQVCAYLTDVEGNFDYFDRYLAISRVLEWADHKKSKLRFKRDDALFVFGGDSQDKGIGDIRIVKLLLALKKEHPERVQFIIGNRDAKKLRLKPELHENYINSDIVRTDSSFPYWDPSDRRVTPQMFLDKNSDDNGGKHNAANRLRYILKHTMGADGAFERRKEELSLIRRCKKDEVTDDEVVHSYRGEVDPKRPKDNFMLQYLKEGKLAYIFGNNLFGWFPPSIPPYRLPLIPFDLPPALPLTHIHPLQCTEPSTRRTSGPFRASPSSSKYTNGSKSLMPGRKGM